MSKQGLTESEAGHTTVGEYSEQETYEAMDVLERQINSLTSQYRTLSKTLPRCVIVRERIKQKTWNGGCSAPAGTVEFWSPMLKRTFPQFRSHRTFSPKLDDAKQLHYRQAERVLSDLRLHNKEFMDDQYVTHRVAYVREWEEA